LSLVYETISLQFDRRSGTSRASQSDSTAWWLADSCWRLDSPELRSVVESKADACIRSIAVSTRWAILG
jgi:hypothetical protein